MTEPLLERLRADLNDARRQRDRARTLVLTTTLSEIKNREIELGHELGDEEARSVVSTAVRRRYEAAQHMRDADRPELAEREESEAELLKKYLPVPLTEADVRARIDAAMAGGAADLGAIMRVIMPDLRGRFDGKDANRLAREALPGG
jgi:uncharacterized protein YqeY